MTYATEAPNAVCGYDPAIFRRAVHRCRQFDKNVHPIETVQGFDLYMNLFMLGDWGDSL